MTTTLYNIKIVGSPDYYLMEDQAGGSSPRAEMANSTLAEYKLPDTKTSYRFKLTKGDLSDGSSGFVAFRFADDGSLTIYYENGLIHIIYAKGGAVTQSNATWALELNKWYILNITFSSYKLVCELCDENDTQLYNYTSQIFNGTVNTSNIAEVTLCAGGDLGAIIGRNSSVTNSGGSIVLADLSDIEWDLPSITSTGSTNAKISAGSEPVLDTLSFQIAANDTLPKTITAPSGVDGYSEVTVSGIANLESSNIVIGARIAGVNGKAIVKNGQTKSVSLTASTSLPAEFFPDSSYNCLNNLTISSIENLAANNVKSGVTIAGVTGSLNEFRPTQKAITIGTDATFPVKYYPEGSANGFSEFGINGIDNLEASNIKAGVTIAGVSGAVVEKIGENKTGYFNASDSLPRMYASSTGYNCMDTFTLTGIENLEAANIKKDVQIAGVTGTYEGSGSSGVITVSAHNDKSSAVQAGQKVLVHKGVVSGVASYSIKDVTNISAPNYLKNYTFGVAVNAIPQAQGGSVVIPADMGTAVGKYVVNTAGQGHAYFNNYNVNDADFGSNYLGYATTQTDGYAQVSLPNVPYTDLSASTITFAFKRIGSATESKHLVAKVTNSWDTSAIRTAESADVFRVYLAGSSSGYTVSLEYKKTDDTFATINIDGTYMTSVGDTLKVTIQLLTSSFQVVVNDISTVTSYTDLTTTENLRNYNIWTPSSNGAVEYLLAYEEGGYDYIGCRYSSGSYGSGYFFGAKYYY